MQSILLFSIFTILISPPKGFGMFAPSHDNKSEKPDLDQSKCQEAALEQGARYNGTPIDPLLNEEVENSSRTGTRRKQTPSSQGDSEQKQIKKKR